MGKFRYVPIFLAVLSVIGNIVINNYWGTDVQYVLWITIVLLVIQIAINEFDFINIRNTQPNIVLKDFGFHFKSLFGTTAACGYIDIANEPKSKNHYISNSDGVVATVIWRNKEKEIDKNRGRWFYPNEDQQGAFRLLTVDLGANGLSRRLHFTFSESKKNPIESFWRSDDKKSINKPLTENNNYDIEIILRDNQSSELKLYFKIEVNISEKGKEPLEVTLQHLTKKNGKPLETKSFNFHDLEQYQKEHPYRLVSFI